MKMRLIRPCRVKVGDQTVRKGDVADVPERLVEKHPTWWEDPDAAEPITADALEEWTVDELQAELRDRDLKVSGAKDELIERLTEE